MLRGDRSPNCMERGYRRRGQGHLPALIIPGEQETGANAFNLTVHSAKPSSWEGGRVKFTNSICEMATWPQESIFPKPEA